jgi:hypothetical protein
MTVNGGALFMGNLVRDGEKPSQMRGGGCGVVAYEEE